MTSSERPAMPGELCTCGRQAVTVFVRPDGRQTGYCGVADGGAQTQCVFCEGRERHGPIGPCPAYRLRLDRCPDGGKCHHACVPGDCFRVRACGPLTGVYPGDGWPPDVMARVADVYAAARSHRLPDE